MRLKGNANTCITVAQANLSVAKVFDAFIKKGVS
jgi:hypothetical protein